ncbi:heme/hemin ABC transporter substrate-binding protein [Sphingobacterium corticibacter]|uniref:Hemin ABC transporter substrate-binding protein n=1 Tax=Sphingobacterium corticibacter TaxID=2171749 RepID=A0A2T8HGI6_9SPHI|nr:ABC transporter substrate-binding protein [Sphingobacterium corticibacter]PVH24559.1 hemin ABC transporter substrate-binding protein [Sphingobacterium corticibacter]
MRRIILFCTALLLSMPSAWSQAKRIVTLSAALSETVHALGMGSRIVAVDVTSEYPLEIKQKPRVSKDRTVSLEGLLSFKPDLVLTPPAELTPETQRKLKQLGVRVVTVTQEYSVKGAQRFIQDVGAAIGAKEEGARLATKVGKESNQALQEIANRAQKPKVLFIYAQGVGLMSVAGKGSQLDAIISLAGGRNAVQEFSDFKPYSTEALIKANPDALLLFDFGISSLGGRNAVLRMPGIGLTKAGKQKNIIAMDGPLLVNFSTRLPLAIRELNKKLYALPQ